MRSVKVKKKTEGGELTCKIEFPGYMDIPDPRFPYKLRPGSEKLDHGRRSEPGTGSERKER